MRTRIHRTEHRDSQELETLSDSELEAFLFDEEEEEDQKKPGIFNLPTVIGGSMVAVGLSWVLQQVGLFGGSTMTGMAVFLLILAILLLFPIGLGFSRGNRKRQKQRKRIARKLRKARLKRQLKSNKTLSASKNNMILGVCGGLAEYFGIDPTIVRILFCIATIATSGFIGIIAYIVLGVIMHSTKSSTSEEGTNMDTAPDPVMIVKNTRNRSNRTKGVKTNNSDNPILIIKD